MRAVLALLMLALASPAIGQERSAAQRETLVELAGVLGEAHALRQVCGGPGESDWRNQFDQMLDVEQADEDFAKRMQSAFNASYAAHRRDFVACTPASRAAEAETALKGRELAAGLSRATIRVAPQPPDVEAEPVVPDPEAR